MDLIMANVTMNMERGQAAAKGLDSTSGKGDRVKLRMKSVPDELKARLRELDARKQKLAEKRGRWDTATPKQRAEARAVAAEIAEVKAEMRAAAEAQRQAELDKQAAAAKRERARRGDD